MWSEMGEKVYPMEESGENSTEEIITKGGDKL